MSLAQAAIYEASSLRGGERRCLRVLTLTPFYPSAEDPTQGCFVADPLGWTESLRTTNEVIAIQPFYRKRLHCVPSNIPSQWKSYASIPGNLGLPFAGELAARTLTASVRGLHRTQPFDLIHAHGALPCGQAAVRLSEKLGIPFAVSVHGLDAFAARQGGRTLSRFCQRASRDVYQRAGSVICISEKVRRRVAEHVAAKTVVIYNGVDADFFYPGPECNSPLIVLSVGNLIPIKDHALLLRAFATISHAIPDSRLEIIGDGPERENLSRLAADLGISAAVRFLGRQRRTVVANAMRRCAIFALPSRYEGLGCVYLEAMASGKPAIGCNAQGIDEIIDHGRNGLLINPGDETGLSEALRTLLQNQELRRKLGVAARNTVLERHTLQRQAQQLTEVYRECAL